MPNEFDMADQSRGCGKGSACGAGKEKCPDCFQCQGCSEDRCRLCRKHGHSKAPTLATGFTYGEYLEWKERRETPGAPDDGPSST